MMFKRFPSLVDRFGPMFADEICRTGRRHARWQLWAMAPRRSFVWINGERPVPDKPLTRTASYRKPKTSAEPTAARG